MQWVVNSSTMKTLNIVGGQAAETPVAPTRRPLLIWLLWATMGLGLVALVVAGVAVATTAPGDGIRVLEQAEYRLEPQVKAEAAGTPLATAPAAAPSAPWQAVTLPHRIPDADIPADGGRVSYRLPLVLDEAPTRPLGIYVPKMSLAGALTINGVWVRNCASGLLEEQRCLHQPQFFSPPVSLWRGGQNWLEFELYVNDRQMNGLSRVEIGPAEMLYASSFAPRYLLQVELLHGLTWVVFSLAVLALILVFFLPREPLYLWFGLSALFNALSNLNVLVSSPAVSPELYSWFVFSARMLTAPIYVLLLLEFFGKARPLFRWTLLGYAALMPVLTWLSGNDRWVVFWAYQPVSLASIAVAIMLLIWTWRSRTFIHIMVTLTAWILLLISVFDMTRLAGKGAFEGIYLVTYALTAGLMIFGVLLLGRLAAALIQERRLSADLRAAKQQRDYLIEERHRLVREMHDGLGTELTTAKIRLRHGDMTQAEASQLLTECIDDLRLVVSAMNNIENDLLSAIAGYHERLEIRLRRAPQTLIWENRLTHSPRIEGREILQIMRILQESINNILNHSQANQIEVKFWMDGSDLRMQVRDNGIGIEQAQAHGATAGGGNGLTTMNQRAQAVGGHLNFQPANPDNRDRPGTLVDLRVPL